MYAVVLALAITSLSPLVRTAPVPTIESIPWQLTDIRFTEHKDGTTGSDSFHFHFSDPRDIWSLETDCDFYLTQTDRDWKRESAQDGHQHPCQNTDVDFAFGQGQILIWRYFGALGTIGGLAGVKWDETIHDDNGAHSKQAALTVPNALSSGR